MTKPIAQPQPSCVHDYKFLRQIPAPSADQEANRVGATHVDIFYCKYCLSYEMVGVKQQHKDTVRVM